jgi:hypothetical protein
MKCRADFIKDENDEQLAYSAIILNNFLFSLCLLKNALWLVHAKESLLSVVECTWA